MSDQPYHKTKTKLVETITSNEDLIRFEIWSGAIPLWEAAHARFFLEWEQAWQHLLRRAMVAARLEARVESMNKTNKDLPIEATIVNANDTLDIYNNNNYTNNVKNINNTILKDRDTMDNVQDTKVIPILKRKATDATPPMGPSDWLSTLPIGTLFTCESNRVPWCEEYHVVDKTEKMIKLLTNMNDPEVYMWWRPAEFCKHYSLVEILIKKDEK